MGESLEITRFDVTATIVVYRNDMLMLGRAINSFLNTSLFVRLYIVDNSPSREIETLCSDKRIEYIFNNENIGFGAAHNIIMDNKSKLGKYHLVLNPDVSFKTGVLEQISEYMDSNQDIGLVMPEVYYPDGKVQFLPKLLPSVSDLFIRRFPLNKKTLEQRNYVYEMQYADYSKPFDIAMASGCFSFFRKSTIEHGVLYDKRFFMYFEDIDISRQALDVARVVCNPQVRIFHEYGHGSHKSFKLFSFFIKSMIQYFCKWGWFFDLKRKSINNELLKGFLKK